MEKFHLKLSVLLHMAGLAYFLQSGGYWKVKNRLVLDCV